MNFDNSNVENKSDIEAVLGGGKDSDRRSIVFCETLFQLFSTLNIFLKYKNHAPVDIVLSDDSDFSRAKAALEKTDIFENIYEFKVKSKITDLWNKTTLQEREVIAKNPGGYIDDIALEHQYTDLWVNLDTMAPKMFYYKLVNMGMTPVVHFVDEGTSSYILDFSATHKDFINHRRLFGELSFRNNLSDMWLSEPRAYCGDFNDIPLYKIPVDVLENEEIIKLYKDIFGDGQLPEEKFIFFEESFAAEGRTTNDLELFRAIVEIVGKDNIIVKRHPRNPIDRFSQLGYKVMGMQSVPWEMMILGKDLSDKVLISVGSSATLTPFYLYGMRPKAFLLKQLLIGKVHYLADPKMNVFFNSVTDLVNNYSVNVYIPNTVKELKLALRYILCFKDNTKSESSAQNRIVSTPSDSDFPLVDYSNKEAEDISELQSDIDEFDESLNLDDRKKAIEEAKAKIDTPYVSVVVPVYNTEKYLRRCLDSLVFQTLENIEIIVVNDGSPDNSQLIIDEYAKRFPDKIISIIQENGGLSAARQHGAERATGKYIGFVDSDDWVDYSYCETCFNTLVLENTKAVVFPVNHVYNSGNVNSGIVPENNQTSTILMSAAASFWSKIYDREFFLENAKFLHMWYEDIPVINPMISYLDRISLVKKCLYYYVRERSDSITNSKIDLRQLDYEKAERTAIETTNPAFRKYQLARSISRVITNNNAAFYDSYVDFVKSYKDEIQTPEVMELFPENVAQKLNDILDDDYTEKIPNIIYLDGFTCKDKAQREKIADYYIQNAFWNEAEVKWLDESSCDVTSTKKINDLYKNKKFRDLVWILSLQKIYESGGVFLGNNLLFSSTLNCVKYDTAFFGFINKKKLLRDVFGGSAGCEVFKKIIDMFFELDLSIADCVAAVLVGMCAITLTGAKQTAYNGVTVYPANVFAFRTDESNICSVLNMNESKSQVTVDVTTYKAMLKYFNELERSKRSALNNGNKRIDKLLARIEKREAKIEKLQARVEKRDSKIDKLQARIEKRDIKIDKLQRRVEKLENQIEKRDIRLEKAEKKNAKYENQLATYNKMSKSILFRVYRKLFKIFHK